MNRTPAQDDWVNRARNADIKEVADRLGAKLKRFGREYVGPCPICGGRDRFSVNTRKQIFNCRGARGGDVIAMVEHVQAVPFLDAVKWITGEESPGIKAVQDRRAVKAAKVRRAAAEQKQRLQETEDNRHREMMRANAHELWKGAREIAGTTAEAYLHHRGIEYRVPSKMLRFGVLAHPEGGRHPTLIAAVTAPDGQFRGIWRIYLKPDGKGRADVENNKLGLGPCSGGAVWLGSSTDEVINVCEGLETGLGVFGILGGKEIVAAALSTSGMVNFRPTIGCGLVRIWPDGDVDKIKDGKVLPSPGLRAATELADRMREMGVKAVIQPTPKNGMDYLDIWNAQRRVA